MVNIYKKMSVEELKRLYCCAGSQWEKINNAMLQDTKNAENYLKENKTQEAKDSLDNWSFLTSWGGEVRKEFDAVEKELIRRHAKFDKFNLGA